MILKYATTEEIQLVLGNRLKAIGVPTQNGTTFGAKQVKPELIQLVQQGVEANIDATLGLIYILPVDPLNEIANAILTDITIDITVAEIFRVHYQMAMTAQMGGDAGYGSVQLNEGIKKLERYTAGYGVYYTGAGNSNNSNRQGNQNQQCVPLPGVPLKPTHDVVRTLQPFSAVAVERNVGSVKINWGI
jgi:hypothetical protein